MALLGHNTHLAQLCDNGNSIDIYVLTFSFFFFLMLLQNLIISVSWVTASPEENKDYKLLTCITMS